MSPQSILIGQIIIVFTTIILTTWYATQWVAFQFDYDAYLGAPWFVIGEHGVYAPWMLFPWWYSFDAYAPHVFAKGGQIATAGGFIGIVFAIIGSVWRGRQNDKLNTFGSSRWASHRQMKSAGLFEDHGVFLGREKKDYIRHDGAEHVITIAPTRSGKGVGLVVPTLLSWTDSAIIHDIKGENWKLTSGWRSKFSNVLLFDPTNPASARYNPLLEVRRDECEVRDVQNIADILVDPEGILERRNHWEKTAHSLLVGAILHVLYAEPEKTLAQVATFLSDPNRPFEDTLYVMMKTNHLGNQDFAKAHPVVAQAARELLNKSDNERSGVLSTAISFLALYRDPTVAKVTSDCDWRIDDLVNGEKPVSLYLVVPPSDISRTKPLIRLILNQIGRRLTESLDVGVVQKRRRVLFMLDEFPALGRLDFFESALAFMAGYGLRAFLIAQSLNQIEKAYGPNNSILDNCHVRVVFATNDDRTAKRISDAVGSTTEMRAMRNYAGHRLAPWLSHVMVSRQETARQLITPGEVMQLPQDEEIILLSGFSPIKTKKLKYYTDKNFTGRVIPPPLLSPEGPYPFSPNSAATDWTENGAPMTRFVDGRLITAAEKKALKNTSVRAGKERTPELPGVPSKSGPEAERENEIGTELSPAELAVLQIGHLPQILNPLQRAHAMNTAIDPELGI
ncbi:conjugal transfer protein TraG [Robiginitomaculum antarcticum]|uniref:conjugal transfer protein TraG n=1 Tax=Robiginitomaculum antarcticum TaxID=437507 RepID=UPI00035C45FD|nr:conjugal transfer protein TraG [Robiginitomaculum antarcticum]